MLIHLHEIPFLKSGCDTHENDPKKTESILQRSMKTSWNPYEIQHFPINTSWNPAFPYIFHKQLMISPRTPPPSLSFSWGLAVFEAEAFGLGEFLDKSNGNVIIPVLTFTPFFQRGRSTTNQIYMYSICIWIWIGIWIWMCVYIIFYCIIL